MKQASNGPESFGEARDRLKRDYWCFLSYRHADNKEPGRQWASWLHQALETYEVPADLVGKKNERGDEIPDRIFPVFRDEEELPADAELSRPIETALRRSKFLVVICSPQAVASRFVDEEIRRFKQLGKQENILAVIVAGEPNASDRMTSTVSFDEMAKAKRREECFPAALRYRVDEQGLVTSDRAEPIAADFRLPDGTPGWTTPTAHREALEAQRVPSLASRSQVDAYAKHSHLMLLKIVSGILGVPLGDLTRRDQAYQLALQQRRTKVLRRWLAAVSSLAAIAVATGFYAFSQQQVAKEQANRAIAGETAALANEKDAQIQKATALANEKEATARLSRSNYFLADARWKEHRAADARALLEAIPPEHRNFEWFLARREYEGSDLTLYGHMAPATGVGFSPDGTQLASAGGQAIKIWDARSGAELRTLAEDTNVEAHVAFSPDGTQLVSAGGRTIKIWDARIGAELQTLAGHTHNVTSVVFSPDGKRLASASHDKTIKLWDARSGAELRTFAGHTSSVTSVAFSPDGTRLASASWDRTIIVWDVRSGVELRTLIGHSKYVMSVAFSPDGARLASASIDGTVRVWDARSRVELRTLEGHRSANWQSVSFSPDGTKLALAADRTIKLWDAVSGVEFRTLAGHTSFVMSMVFSPDGARLASASLDGTIRVWDARSGVEPRTLSEHQGFVLGVTFSPNGAQLASASHDKTIKIWDVRSGVVLRTLVGHTDEVKSVAFSPDGARLASASADRTVKVWDARSGAELFTLEGNTHFKKSVAFSPDGKRLASASKDKTVKVWDVQTGAELRALAGHTDEVTSVTFSPNGSWLASASEDRTVKVWDARSWEELHTLKTPQAPVTSLAFSPDSTLAGGGPGLKIWDACSGAELRTLWGAAGSVAFSPDGSRLASVSTDRKIKVWDAHSGVELRTLAGHTHYVVSVAFSPDGTRLASASWDSTIKVWDARTTAERRTLAGHNDVVQIAVFSPDGSRLFSGDASGRPLAWDVATGEEVAAPKTWPNFNNLSNRSPNGKWLATFRGYEIQLIDLTYKDDPDEKAYREYKAKLDPFWHREQAEAAEKNSPTNAYAALFHRAWVFKGRAEIGETYDRLHAAYEAYRKDFAARVAALPNDGGDKKDVTPMSTNPDDYLAPTVREMLKLPRPK